MLNREKEKWAPFNSIINGNNVLQEIDYEKQAFIKPVLSDEQIFEIENKILNSYSEHTNINIIYYFNKHAYKLNGIVTKLDTITKKITLNNKKSIYFSNILKII